MLKPYIANLLSACALAAGLFGFLGEAHAASAYKIQIDCYGVGGVPNWSHSGSNLYLEFYVNGSWRPARPFGQDAYGAGAVPASLCNAEYELGGVLGNYMQLGMIQKIRIRTTGSDTFWVDRLKLTQLSNGAWWEWGTNNTSGYCFSTDPNDAYAECWNGHSYSAIEFNF
ncbi:MAG TPA: hypothetical protein VFG30_32465 [Polyangiales bacterium]|nr:hypothetical protein [Polyangiales bacterium]